MHHIAPLNSRVACRVWYSDFGYELGAGEAEDAADADEAALAQLLDAGLSLQPHAPVLSSISYIS